MNSAKLVSSDCKKTTWEPISFLMKPLAPKNDDCYFEGCLKKKDKKKVSKGVGMVISPPQSMLGNQWWGGEKKRDPSIPPPSKAEEYEEIQTLSLTDFKVYKKLCPRASSPDRCAWKDDDFPGIQNLYGGNDPKECTHSLSYKGNKSARRGHCDGLCCHRKVSLVSTYSQTENGQFRVDISASNPDAMLCRKIPVEQRDVVMNIIALNHENRSVIDLLSSLFFRFMVSILYGTDTSNILSDSDKQKIESVIYEELQGLTALSSRSTRGKSRFQSISTCFNELFGRFPGLQVLPGFSDLTL